MSRLKKVLSLYWFVYSFKASSKLVPEIKRQFCTAFHFHPRSSQPRHAWWWTSNMMFGVMLLTISQSHSILLILWLHYGETKCCDMMSSIIWYFFPSLIHIKCVNEIVSLTIFSGVSWIEQQRLPEKDTRTSKRGEPQQGAVPVVPTRGTSTHNLRHVCYCQLRIRWKF